ncbi:hypothetical protein Q9G87_33695 [Nonomuraea sp. G32]|nr:hypothetical protein [Nonomuraea sp. G32]MDP4506968.1 hypothetical protein [Nonomuraea sp. G32]
MRGQRQHAANGYRHGPPCYGYIAVVDEVTGADLLLMIPARLLLAMPLQVGCLQAELLGDVVDHRGGNVLGTVQEAVQEPCCAQLQGPAELVARAVGGHRPVPVIGI